MPSGISATTAPCSAMRIVERAILLGVDDVDAAGDDRDRAGGERAEMRGGVDAARQAGDDDDALLAELGGEVLRQPSAVGRGVARADHRDHRRRSEPRRAPSTDSTGGASSIAARVPG